MGKARVAPRKTVSIPRLELAAATVSVKMTDVLKDELNYEGLQEYYWTDSKVVLGYISNESKRFHVYVANRVQLIQDLSSPSQWRYISSAENPADEGSRGMTAKQFVEKSKWLEGPEFLKNLEETWLTGDIVESKIDATDPEVKVNVNANVVTEKNDMLSRLDRFPSLYMAKAAVAICLRYNKKLREKPITKNDESMNQKPESVEWLPIEKVSVDELQKAELEIVKIVQSEAFSAEIKNLKDIQADSSLNNRLSDKKKKAVLKKTSVLHTLDPFVDSDGILKVGGRIRRANFAETLKTPIILLKSGHFTRLVIGYIHEKTLHGGRGITMNELRAHGYWIINGNTVIRRFISECVTCRRLRGTAGEQKMADLPLSRLEDAPPFTYSAVDYFGPWYVKEGRKEAKRYGALFTCMASRAIHIEVAHSMETDSFIQALRRFICRRGAIRELRSDRGTNFIGAENELKRAVEEMDDDKIKAELCKDGIDWIKNPAKASNFGGVWERQIRSVRNVMNALMRQHGRRLDDESLRTFICESEAIVNGRPLTVQTLNDPLSPLPLTPSALLTGKTKLVLPPPGKFQKEDVYCRRRWRRVQHLSNQFWDRWRKEYLQNLQKRSKWTGVRRNFRVGDVVLPIDVAKVRNQWPMARVTSVNEDDQGLVRSATVRTASGSTLDRPINKLVLLVEASEEEPDKTG